LARKLRKYIRAYAKSAKPFRWTYTDAKRRIRPAGNDIAGTVHFMRNKVVLTDPLEPTGPTISPGFN